MRPLGFVGPTFPPEVNERLQYEVLLPFMLHIIYDAFGRGCDGRQSRQSGRLSAIAVGGFLSQGVRYAASSSH
jgi:hypothetical protein